MILLSYNIISYYYYCPVPMIKYPKKGLSEGLSHSLTLSGVTNRVGISDYYYYYLLDIPISIPLVEIIRTRTATILMYPCNSNVNKMLSTISVID